MAQSNSFISSAIPPKAATQLQHLTPFVVFAPFFIKLITCMALIMFPHGFWHPESPQRTHSLSSLNGRTLLDSVSILVPFSLILMFCGSMVVSKQPNTRSSH
eukprot:GABV01011706.1.p1 GENE.GABV01011706.1~~GABV01011706.1.p1  ORF type:complete len:102 (-),score=9.19 GABV01011706.1:11-316(-)